MFCIYDLPEIYLVVEKVPRLQSYTTDEIKLREALAFFMEIKYDKQFKLLKELTV